MEFIFGLIAIYFGFWLFGTILRFISSVIGSAGKAAIGKGSFSENMDVELHGMGEFQARLKNVRLDEQNDTSPIVKQILGKGIFPIHAETHVGFITSVFDDTSGEYEPVISAIDTFQEEDSVIYQHRADIGDIEVNQGFIRWAKIGVVIPEILEPPYGGERKLVALVRMIDLDNPPEIQHGFHEKNAAGILWQTTLSFDYSFNEKGYLEATEHRDESIGIALKIGMAVAMADGTLDDSEGRILKNWIIKSIMPFSEEKKSRLKELYNTAMKDAYSEAQNGTLLLTNLTSRLNEIGEKSAKYDAIELCFEVMAADGVADVAELNMIRGVAIALGLNMDEVEKMRDQEIINLDTKVSGHATIEVMLGIKNDWTKEQTKKHLRNEFQKWNNRLNALPEGKERQNAQLMLDRIADARKQYA